MKPNLKKPYLSFFVSLFFSTLTDLPFSSPIFFSILLKSVAHLITETNSQVHHPGGESLFKFDFGFVFCKIPWLPSDTVKRWLTLTSQRKVTTSKHSKGNRSLTELSEQLWAFIAIRFDDKASSLAYDRNDWALIIWTCIRFKFEGFTGLFLWFWIHIWSRIIVIHKVLVNIKYASELRSRKLM